jgi:hypothetical protein
MIYPQTFAEEIADNIKPIAKYGCLAMCYLYCVGIEDTLEMIRIISDCMKKGILDNECTVTNARRYLQYVTGKNYDVTKEQFNDLKKVKGYPVRYVYNGKGHWVVVDNGKIVFNSLINSQCVTKGKPDTKENTRVIKLAR